MEYEIFMLEDERPLTTIEAKSPKDAKEKFWLHYALVIKKIR